MGKELDKPIRSMTPEELEVWRKEQVRRKNARSHIKSIQVQAANKLKRELETPERKEKEVAFAAQHAADSDEELYAYVKELRGRLGRNMKPINTIGYACIVERLGRWDLLMGRIKADLDCETGPAEVKPEAQTMAVRWYAGETIWKETTI